MPTIIDSLIVALTLDPAGFNKGRKETGDGFKKTRDEAASTGKELEIYGKRASTFFSSLRNEAVGLFLAFQGASSVTDFIKNMLVGDAATGRLAHNIGMATSELSAWQLAVKATGGTVEDANGALEAMANAYQSYQLTGTTGMDADLRGLGVSLADLKNGPAQALLKMAEAGEKMDKTEFFARLKRVGIPDSVINTLEKGRAATEKLVAEKRRDGAATDADAEAAQKFQERLAELEAKITGMVRPSLYRLVTVLLDFLDGVEKGTVELPSLNTALLVVAGTAALLGSPFIAAGAAIVLLISHLDDLKKAYAHVVFATHGWIGGRDLYQSMVNAGVKNNDDIDRIIDGEHAAAGGGGGYSDSFKRSMGAPSQAALDRIAPGRGGGGSGYAAGNAGSIQAALMRAGFSAEQARGIWAGMTAEGGSLGMAENGAFGIGQWRGGRQKALFGKYGRNPSADQQLAFLISELKGGDPGGRGVMNSSSAEDALSNYIGGDNWGFMRPGAGRGGDMRRGMAALGGGGLSRPRAPVAGGGSRTTTTTATVGTIIINTKATDADGIARELPGAIQRRGLTTQANRGLE
jgi:hypothetical protein